MGKLVSVEIWILLIFIENIPLYWAVKQIFIKNYNFLVILALRIETCISILMGKLISVEKWILLDFTKKLLLYAAVKIDFP